VLATERTPANDRVWKLCFSSLQAVYADSFCPNFPIESRRDRLRFVEIGEQELSRHTWRVSPNVARANSLTRAIFCTLHNCFKLRSTRNSQNTVVVDAF